MRANPKTPPKKDESDNEDNVSTENTEDDPELDCGEFVEEFASTLCQPRYMKQITSQLVNSIGINELDDQISELTDTIETVELKSEKLNKRISSLSSDVSCSQFFNVINFLFMLYTMTFVIVRRNF